MVRICIWLNAYTWIAESGIWVAKKVLIRCFPSWRVHAAQTIQTLRSTWCSDQCVSATKEESDYKIHDKSSSKNIHQTSSDSNTLEYQWINKETGSHFDSPIYTVPVFMMTKTGYTGSEQHSKPVTAWKTVSQHKKCLPLIFFQALWSETVLGKTMRWLCGKPFVYARGKKKSLLKTFTSGWLKLPNRKRLEAKPNF